MKYARFLPLLVALLAAAGCGGSGHANPTTGRFVVRFKWPVSTGRVIPTAAQSILVQVLKGATVTNSALLTPGSPTTTLTEVPTGSVTVKAIAYPVANGTGNALASAQSVQTVTTSGPNTVDLTMASTIDHLAITPNPINLALLGVLTQQTTVTAYDSSNAIVLTGTGDLTYTSSGISLFIVGPTGLVTGVALGNATLTVTDSISGKSATAPVNITLH